MSKKNPTIVIGEFKPTGLEFAIKSLAEVAAITPAGKKQQQAAATSHDDRRDQLKSLVIERRKIAFELECMEEEDALSARSRSDRGAPLAELSG